jgi:hypothetical protein
MRHRLSQFPEIDQNQDLLDAIITVGKKEEFFEAEEKQLKCFKEEAKPSKQLKRVALVEEASKWKAVKTEPGTDQGMGKKKLGPKDRNNLTEEEKEEKEKLLKEYHLTSRPLSSRLKSLFEADKRATDNTSARP